MKSVGQESIQRAFVYLCAVILPLVSTSILVLQPDWSKVFLGVSAAVALLALFVMPLPRDLYARALILFAACLAFIAIKLIHDWALDLPVRLDKYLSLTARLAIAAFFAIALANNLQLMLRALFWFSVVIAIHAIIGQIVVIFAAPSIAPLLDASQADSFTYYQVAWLFFYSQTVSITDALTVYRAHGVMWEPGIFQFFCNYIIVYGFAHYTGSRRLFLVLLGLTAVILSTSTTGILLAGIIILMRTRFSWRSLVAVGAVMIIPAIFVLAGKFSIGTAQSLSTVMRLIDLEVPLNYAIRFPLLGVGNDSSVVQILGVHSYVLDYLLNAGQQQFLSSYVGAIFETDRVFNTSNGLLALAMQYGVVFAGMYVYGLRNFSKWSGLGRSSFTLLLVAILNEPVELTSLFLWMSMYGLVMPRHSRRSLDAHVRHGRINSSSLTLQEAT